MRLLVAIHALLTLAIPAQAADFGPDSIRAMLAMRNPRQVVQAIDNGDAENNPWFGVLDHIEAGEPDWLDLVPLLARGTDAGTAEGLVISLSHTLKTNAPAVLKLLSDGQFSVEDICNDNDIEVPLGDYIAFLDTIAVTVAAVLEPSLREVRNQCLHRIGVERVTALVDGY